MRLEVKRFWLQNNTKSLDLQRGRFFAPAFTCPAASLELIWGNKNKRALSRGRQR